MNSQSDSEFWEDLDSRPSLQQITLGASGTKALAGLLQTVKQGIAKKKVPDGNYYKILERVRLANGENLQNEKIIAQKEMKKLYEGQLKILKGEFEDKLNSMQSRYDHLKIIMNMKDKETAELRRYATEQELLLIECRNIPPLHLATTQEKSVNSKKDVAALTLKLEALRHVCAMYRDQNEQYKSRCAELTNEIVEVSHQCENRVCAVQSECNERESRFSEEKQKVICNFNEYKREVAKEIEIHLTIQNKQNEVIRNLQEELKGAKLVLQNPRLRTKYYSKLQDYIKEHNTPTCRSRGNSSALGFPESSLRINLSIDTNRNTASRGDFDNRKTGCVSTMRRSRLNTSRHLF